MLLFRPEGSAIRHRRMAVLFRFLRTSPQAERVAPSRRGKLHNLRDPAPPTRSLVERACRWQPPHYRQASAQSARGRRSEEHTSELQSLMRISYAVFCLKKKIMTNTQT